MWFLLSWIQRKCLNFFSTLDKNSLRRENLVNNCLTSSSLLLIVISVWERVQSSFICISICFSSMRYSWYLRIFSLSLSSNIATTSHVFLLSIIWLCAFKISTSERDLTWYARSRTLYISSWLRWIIMFLMFSNRFPNFLLETPTYLYSLAQRSNFVLYHSTGWRIFLLRPLTPHDLFKTKMSTSFSFSGTQQKNPYFLGIQTLLEYELITEGTKDLLILGQRQVTSGWENGPEWGQDGR